MNEHDLELRVKAANEAEAACQQRLSAAEAEIAELRAELDASDRFLFLMLASKLMMHFQVIIICVFLECLEMYLRENLVRHPAALTIVGQSIKCLLSFLTTVVSVQLASTSTCIYLL